MDGQKHTKRHVPCALREEVVLPVDVDHPVLEDALPLILHTRNLTYGGFASSANSLSTRKCDANLVVCAKHDILFRRAPHFVDFLIIRIGVIEIAIDRFVVIYLRSALRWLWQRWMQGTRCVSLTAGFRGS